MPHPQHLAPRVTGVSPEKVPGEQLARSFPAVLRAPIVPRVIRFAEDMLEKDLRDNRNMGTWEPATSWSTPTPGVAR